MKRKLFFLLEKLEIKRSERIAISVLLTMLVLLSGVLTVQESSPNYDEEEYQKLEKIFTEKSRAQQLEEDIILARYEPTQEISVTTSVRKNSEPEVTKPDTTNEGPQKKQSDELININTATNTQLQELPGIGPAYASRIVAWREENGAFTFKDQLLEIKGIGEKRLAGIKPLITL